MGSFLLYSQPAGPNIKLVEIVALFIIKFTIIVIVFFIQLVKYKSVLRLIIQLL